MRGDDLGVKGGRTMRKSTEDRCGRCADKMRRAWGQLDKRGKDGRQ